MNQICTALGFDGFENVETFFLHSQQMGKKKLIKKYKENVTDYTNCLKAHIKDKTVLVVFGVITNKSISRKTIMASAWLMYQTEILGVNFATTELIAVKEKEGKVTYAFLVHNKKIFSFMAGRQQSTQVYRKRLRNNA